MLQFILLKRLHLKNPATALKVFFAGNKVGTSDIKVLFKILRSDSAEDFDELGYEFLTHWFPRSNCCHL